MRDYIYIAIGSMVGGGLRVALSQWLSFDGEATFPWPTLLVNVCGCILIGFVAAAIATGGRWANHAHWRPLIMTGFCGGFTTFSIFSWQTLVLWQTGHTIGAALYVLVSVAACLAGVAIGDLTGTYKAVNLKTTNVRR